MTTEIKIKHSKKQEQDYLYLIYCSENEESIRVKTFFNTVIDEFSIARDLKFQIYEITNLLLLGYKIRQDPNILISKTGTKKVTAYLKEPSV